jgi:hypothetical protein
MENAAHAEAGATERGLPSLAGCSHRYATFMPRESPRDNRGRTMPMTMRSNWSITGFQN